MGDPVLVIWNDTEKAMYFSYMPNSMGDRCFQASCGSLKEAITVAEDRGATGLREKDAFSLGDLQTGSGPEWMAMYTG